MGTKAHHHHPIRVARKNAGLTQTQFASRIGVSQGQVSSWERGHAIPTPRQSEVLSREFGFSEAEFARMAEIVGSVATPRLAKIEEVMSQACEVVEDLTLRASQLVQDAETAIDGDPWVQFQQSVSRLPIDERDKDTLRNLARSLSGVSEPV